MIATILQVNQDTRQMLVGFYPDDVERDASNAPTWMVKLNFDLPVQNGVVLSGVPLQNWINQYGKMSAQSSLDAELARRTAPVETISAVSDMIGVEILGEPMSLQAPVEETVQPVSLTPVVEV